MTPGGGSTAAPQAFPRKPLARNLIYLRLTGSFTTADVLHHTRIQ
jgi:hypothetical protein